MQHAKKAGCLLVSLFMLQTLLVSTHLGEFWPFSIYPMFSRGGHPWVRAVIRDIDVPDASDPSLWHPTTIDNLPGLPYALANVRISQNDIANFIAKSRHWDAQRIAGLRKVFEADLQRTHLLILRADGRIDGDSVSVIFTPFLLLAPASTSFNPNLHYPTDARGPQ